MDIMSLIRRLSGESDDNRQTNQMIQRGQLPQEQMEIYPQNPPVPQGFAEDDGYVSTAQGMRPLSEVPRGAPWRNLQNGYSPPGREYGAEDDVMVMGPDGPVPAHTQAPRRSILDYLRDIYHSQR